MVFATFGAFGHSRSIQKASTDLLVQQKALNVSQNSTVLSAITQFLQQVLMSW